MQVTPHTWHPSSRLWPQCPSAHSSHAAPRVWGGHTHTPVSGSQVFWVWAQSQATREIRGLVRNQDHRVNQRSQDAAAAECLPVLIISTTPVVPEQNSWSPGPRHVSWEAEAPPCWREDDAWEMIRRQRRNREKARQGLRRWAGQAANAYWASVCQELQAPPWQ